MIFWLLMTTFSTIFDVLLYKEVDKLLGINAFVFTLFTNIFEDCMHMKYTIVTYCTINAKVTPRSVEATIFSVLTGLGNFSFGVIGSLYGAFICTSLGINSKNLERLDEALMIKLFLSFLPLLLIKLIPNKEEIDND